MKSSEPNTFYNLTNFQTRTNQTAFIISNIDNRKNPTAIYLITENTLQDTLKLENQAIPVGLIYNKILNRLIIGCSNSLVYLIEILETQYSNKNQGNQVFSKICFNQDPSSIIILKNDRIAGFDNNNDFMTSGIPNAPDLLNYNNHHGSPEKVINKNNNNNFSPKIRHENLNIKVTDIVLIEDKIIVSYAFSSHFLSAKNNRRDNYGQIWSLLVYRVDESFCYHQRSAAHGNSMTSNFIDSQKIPLNNFIKPTEILAEIPYSIFKLNLKQVNSNTWYLHFLYPEGSVPANPVERTEERDILKIARAYENVSDR